PFSQIDASTTRQFGGTGLGLAISQKLVEYMGGRIWIEPKTEKGAVLHFTIHAQPIETSRDPWAIGLPYLAGKQVLILEQSPTNQQILVRRLKQLGMEPHCASSAEESLERLGMGGLYDAAILDLDYPSVDVPALANALRISPAQEPCRILVL